MGRSRHYSNNFGIDGDSDQVGGSSVKSKIFDENFRFSILLTPFFRDSRGGGVRL